MFLWYIHQSFMSRDEMIDQTIFDVFKKDELNILGSVCMKTATGDVLVGWLASQTDMFANDWIIVD